MSYEPTSMRKVILARLPYVVARLPYIGSAAVVCLFLLIVWSLFDQSNTLPTRVVHALMGDPERQWGLASIYLLLALPFGAIIVVFVRSILGLQTFGLFTPMLLALAYLQSGPILGPTVSTAAIIFGMIAAPLLKRLELSRVAFLGALISIVVTGLGTMAMLLDNMIFISAFPVVVTALVVERWWSSWEADGPRKAIKITGVTLVVALVIQFVVASPVLRYLVETLPLAIPMFSAAAMILLGRYKGLRLSEMARFRAAREV